MSEDGSDRRGPFDDLKEDSHGDSESIRVAVRVRPFNAREAARGCKCCVEMSGETSCRIPRAWRRVVSALAPPTDVCALDFRPEDDAPGSVGPQWRRAARLYL